ncbi:MAG: transcription antitermination factor NusB [Clostridiales bacterium GWF2_38_85]|nr:MAG: transcription antitermination factor NusB [Clostridiales bacterium GWF2_38_85]HBL85427.1 transcription antitermination factor NusB [Clostridiales bacterium]
MNRREARGIALELLFEYDFNRDKKPEQIIVDAIEWREIKVNQFAKYIFGLAAEHMQEIDTMISEKAANWRFDRMSRLAKAIMRLCIAEIVYTGTPDSVAINEAVELAKDYDDEKGVSFINGVLGGVVRALPNYQSRQVEVFEDDDGEAENEITEDIKEDTDE